jgi:hypothetical protein
VYFESVPVGSLVVEVPVAWFWTDDLARLLIERGGVAPGRVAHWISAPVAHRGEGEALDIAATLLAAEADDTGVEEAATSAA